MRKNLNLMIAVISGVLTSCLFIFYPVDKSLDNWLIDNQTTVAEKIKEPVITTLLFGGDVMLARTVEQKILKNKDWTLPFQEIYTEWQSADLAFVNLESPFYDKGQPTPNGSFIFRALPETIAGLNLAGLDIVSLANNHFGNQGQAGMEFTMNLLTQNNIKYCGAGFNNLESHQSIIIEKNSIRFAFLGYDYINSYLATQNQAGTNNMDIEQMTNDVATAKTQADIIIVSMHAGTEYVYTPNQQQVDFAHAAIEAGADLVIGHHPHVVQSYEQYQDGYIFYSLGNLVFDQSWSVPTTEGVAAKVILENKRIQKIEFLPVKIIDNFQPTWGNEETSQAILSRLQVDNLSIEIN